MMSGRVEAGQRLHRLLAVLTWLARVGHAPVSELAERFGMSAEDLVADLELAACCGLPPYTPDQLMEIVVDDQEVTANLGPELARPRRLTAAEGFALAAAGRAILSTPGADPEGALARALDKLEQVLGADGRLRVALGEPPHLQSVRVAIDGKRQLRVRYYSLSSDEETERVIDPFALSATDGQWYVDAFCHRAGGMRRFRVDRFQSVAETGEAIDHDPPHQAPETIGSISSSGPFVAGPDATVVRVAVGDAAMGLLDAVPKLSVTSRPDGRSEVELGVASEVWFERLILRLGPNAEVLSPPELVEAGRRAARRLLDRYEAVTG